MMLFVINAVVGIPMSAMVREIWGFHRYPGRALVLIILFPEITLLLPRPFGYGG